MPYKNREDYKKFRRKWQKNLIPGTETYKKYHAVIKANAKFKEAQKCSVKECTEIGQRHHEDYDKPLEITWLCKYHHKMRHLEIKQAIGFRFSTFT